jgi:hypothetical protein
MAFNLTLCVFSYDKMLATYLAHQPGPYTLFAMPTTKTWKHPADDERFDPTLYIGHSEQDPRACGAGPCGKQHLVALIDSKTDPKAMLFNGNQAARWVDCATCGLRMGTYPFKGYTGKFMVDVHPTIVAEALSRILETNKWNDCNKKLVDGMIKIIEGERQVDAAAKSTSVRSRPKPQHIPAKSQVTPPKSGAVLEGPREELQAVLSVASKKETEVGDFILVTCQICSGEGHGARECPELQAHLAQGQQE